MKKKVIAAAVVLTLVLGLTVGGTLAWLMDKTDPVRNTFTYGDVTIALTETTTEYKMVPGNTISKDPKVTVKASSEACWLFVKVEESSNFDSFMTYDIATGWSELESGSGVYYREVAATAADTDFPVLKDNLVSVKNTVTKEMLHAEDFVSPTLTFTAYAVQKDGFATAAAAWAEVNKPLTP